ncbi:MAG: hypothetical protein HN726_00250 [Candidatus Magasanikbacteria bacterium]|jgi:hypothetical protein|nr:hypothetical protein [Candidatus Magasanikbacteria bacterium]MBT4221066.1 hypothetical protein [Candidatus Magasanikbacteria bacterium]MBT4350590.1 hypothetical protein [Candidatus Magasanikbacteria bacterium]MBT4542111.1 hypothetical protein [Candidatus Magasanikbacteria bacterium]MBT6253233.1 hypothetical protein [Candidatus Magasanikbacteria bacterium]
MKALLFIIAIILFGFVSYISFLNRGHEKIVEIFATSIVLGIGTALFSMTFILKPQYYEKSFISSVTVQHDRHDINLQEIDYYDSLKDGRNFPSIPYSNKYLRVKQFYFQKFPEEFDVKKEKLDLQLYLDILTYSILTDMFNQFSNAWTSNVEYIDLPTGSLIRGNHGEEKAYNVITWDDIIKQTDYRIFEKFKPNDLIFPPGGNMKIPKNSKLKISSKPRRFTLTMEDKIGKFQIRVRSLQGSRSAGEIGSMLGIPTSDHQNFTTYTYEIKFISEIKKWRSGSPEVVFRKKWFSTIEKILIENYSYNKYLENAKEWYLMYGKK